MNGGKIVLQYKRKSGQRQESSLGGYQIQYCDAKLFIMQEFSLQRPFVPQKGNWETLKQSGTLSEEEYIVVRMIDSRCGEKAGYEKMRMFHTMQEIQVLESENKTLEVFWENNKRNSGLWVELSESLMGFKVVNTHLT